LWEFAMPGLVPGIHVLKIFKSRKAWMAGSSPAMTEKSIIYIRHKKHA
jgi:hypothetical protein